MPKVFHDDDPEDRRFGTADGFFLGGRRPQRPDDNALDIALVDVAFKEFDRRRIAIRLPFGKDQVAFRRDGANRQFSQCGDRGRATIEILLSAHRDDPLTELGLTSGDYADIVADLLTLVAPGRRLVFLEGGYDLEAIARSTAATVSAMYGERLHPEAPTSGGPGDDVVERVTATRDRVASLGS